MSSDSVFYSGNLPHSTDVEDEMKMFVLEMVFSVFLNVISFALLKPNIRTMHQIELKNHYVVETGAKNTDPPQVTDKLLSHNYVSSTPRLSGVRTRNGSGDIIGSCKSNYHTITTTNAP